MISRIAFFAFFCASAANAATIYKVGVENLSYLPYYTSDSGSYSGFAKELLDGFSQFAGITLEYKSLPINRLFESFLAKESELDFKFPDSEFWNSDSKKGRKILYSNDSVSFIDGVMVTPGNKGKGIGELKNLGIARGFTAWDYMKEIESQKIRVTENDNVQALLEATLMGRVNGAYINVAVAKYLLSEKIKKPEALAYDEKLPHTKGGYKISSIKHPQLIAKFNKYLTAKKSDIDALKKKWNL